MSKIHTHDEAIDAICGTLGVTVLSYQEAIEGYLALRGLKHLASADTRPEGGDATEIAAPFTSGAVPNGETPQ